MFPGPPRASACFGFRAAAAVTAYIYQRLTETAENDVVRAWNSLFADRNP
jgi:hypothetical protein